jgi:quercetin dioxygenase-like cupin family protein
MKAHRLVDSISWQPHPTAKGVRIKPMISLKEHNLDVTCMLVDIPAGIDIPEHIHETQDDILYPLHGKGVMWVDGNGDFALEPGVIVKVPKGIKHKITDVTEDLLLYDVFCPALM